MLFVRKKGALKVGGRMSVHVGLMVVVGGGEWERERGSGNNNSKDKKRANIHKNI